MGAGCSNMGEASLAFFPRVSTPTQLKNVEDRMKKQDQKLID